MKGAQRPPFLYGSEQPEGRCSLRIARNRNRRGAVSGAVRRGRGRGRAGRRYSFGGVPHHVAFHGKIADDAADAHFLDALDIGLDGGGVLSGVTGKGIGMEARRC